MTDPKDLREQINKLGTDMKALIDGAKTENRSLTPDEESKFDKMDADREKALADERRLLRVQELESGEGRRAEPRQPAEDREEGGRRAKVTEADEMDAFRAWIVSGTDQAPTSQMRAAARKCNIDPRHKMLNLRMSKQAMRSLKESDQRRWEERALSTLTSTSPEDGSYLIANEAMGPLERAMLAFGQIRNVATVKRTATGAAYPIPTNDDTSNKGALLAENTIAVEKDIEFGQVTLNAFKFTSKKVLVSLELMQDSNEDLAALIGSALGERIGRITNDYFTTGTGSSEPKGVVTGATTSGVTLGTKTPTYVELVGTEAGLDPAYRPNASWMFHDTELQEIKKIVDGQTRPLWLPSMSGGAPDRILGYPYTVNQSMAVAASTGSGKSILFGDFSKFLIRDVRDIVLMRLDELYAEYYQVAFVAFSRHDSDILDAGTHPIVYTANHS